MLVAVAVDDDQVGLVGVGRAVGEPQLVLRDRARRACVVHHHRELRRGVGGGQHQPAGIEGGEDPLLVIGHRHQQAGRTQHVVHVRDQLGDGAVARGRGRRDRQGVIAELARERRERGRGDVDREGRVARQRVHAGRAAARGQRRVRSGLRIEAELEQRRGIAAVGNEVDIGAARSERDLEPVVGLAVHVRRDRDRDARARQGIVDRVFERGAQRFEAAVGCVHRRLGERDRRRRTAVDADLERGVARDAVDPAHRGLAGDRALELDADPGLVVQLRDIGAAILVVDRRHRIEVDAEGHVEAGAPRERHLGRRGHRVHREFGERRQVDVEFERRLVRLVDPDRDPVLRAQRDRVAQLVVRAGGIVRVVGRVDAVRAQRHLEQRA